MQSATRKWTILKTWNRQCVHVKHYLELSSEDSEIGEIADCVIAAE